MAKFRQFNIVTPEGVVLVESYHRDWTEAIKAAKKILDLASYEDLAHLIVSCEGQSVSIHRQLSINFNEQKNEQKKPRKK